MSLSHRPATRAVRRLLATTTASAMVIALGPLVGPAAAQTPRGIDDVCPPPGQEQTPDAFTDDEATVHEPSINCAAAYDIALGKTSTQYDPLVDVKRDQMASFIARLIRTAGGNLPASPPDAFADDEQSVHENNINALAAANVVQGKSATQYDPNNRVRRDQMATFIANAVDFIDDGNVNDSLPPDTTTNFFTDDDQSVHHENINELAGVGIVAGRSNNQYDPDDFVDRAAMATFLMQSADFLAERGLWAPLAQVTVTGVPDQPQQGEQITATVEVPQGETIASVRVVGCGVDETVTTDEVAGTTGFQVQFTIPATQTAGQCTLRFIVTTGDGDVLEERVTVNVQSVTAVQGATEAPELVSAAIIDRDPVLGTRVRFVFDEAVTGKAPDVTKFQVFQFDRDVFQANSAVIQSDNNSAVVARFPGLTAQAEVDALTLATVERGAVADAQADENPIGDAPLTPAAAPITAGRTDEPDLISVGNFRASGTNTLVTFTFDENAFLSNQATAFFGLVRNNGTDVESRQVVAGNGTTTLDVLFTTPTALTQADVARAFVDENTVDDESDGVINDPGDGVPLEAVDLAGNSEGPDLTTVEFRPNPADADCPAGTRPCDQVLFNFDESLAATANPNAFLVFQSDAAGFTAVAAQVSGSRVLASFPDGVLDTAVVASAEEGAVTGIVDTPMVNREDAVAQAGAGAVVQAGRTAAPDLVSAAKTQLTDPFGTVTGFRITYTFDEDVTNPVAARFHAVLRTGVRLGVTPVCTVPTGEDVDNTVRCDFTGATARNEANNVVLGTVEIAAVTEEVGTLTNPQGAAPLT